VWLTAKLTKRIEAEFGIDLAPYSYELAGEYFLQGRFVVGPTTPRRVVHAIVGVGGEYERRKLGTWDETLPDKSTLRHPPHTFAEVGAPQYAGVGLDVLQVLGRHVAFRADGQLLLWTGANKFVAPRVSAGLVLPLGSYPARVP
jgi:hypothetical protein